MCDYSLHAVNTRKAAIGDKLVTTTFWGTSTRGFADAAAEGGNEGLTAVCLMPGAELAFDKPITSDRSFMSLLTCTMEHKHKTAVFAKIDMLHECAHHDALEFPDGSTVLLTCLTPGQRATVLQLGVEPKAEAAKQAPPATSLNDLERMDYSSAQPPTTPYPGPYGADENGTPYREPQLAR